MASKRAAQQFQWLARNPRLGGKVAMPFRPAACSRRFMATVSEKPVEEVVLEAQESPSHDEFDISTGPMNKDVLRVDSATDTHPSQPPHTILTTVYSFPRMEPKRFEYYPSNHLYLPLRRDILHSAVIFEGDRARQGTHSTKWRDEVHGSHRKLYPQKGLGKARVGDKQSPIRRGGGVAHGPKPRDHSSKLNRKVYDLAWRTALSYRYRRGELLVVDRMTNPRTAAPYYMKQIFDANGWGNRDGRSLLVASEVHKGNKKVFQGVERIGEDARMLTVNDVDVKNLLEMGRVIIEFEALNTLLMRHSADLVPSIQPLGQIVEQQLEESPPIESSL